MVGSLSMSTLFLLITHHAPLQLRIQLKNLPAGARYIALRHHEGVYTIHDSAYVLVSGAISSEDELFNFIDKIRREHGITALVLCCDANLGEPGLPEMSCRLKQIIRLLQPLQCLLYSQEVGCIKNTYEYLSNLSEMQPGYRSILCMQDVFRANYKTYFSRIHAGEYSSKCVWESLTKENEILSITQTTLQSREDSHSLLVESTHFCQVSYIPPLSKKTNCCVRFFGCFFGVTQESVGPEALASARRDGVPVSYQEP